jgi:hypothetical protein
MYQAAARSFVAKPRDETRLPSIMIRACHFLRKALTPGNPVLFILPITSLFSVSLGYVLG